MGVHGLWRSALLPCAQTCQRVVPVSGLSGCSHGEGIMTQQPCKSCLESRPNHKRQVIVIRDGERVQICERCHVVIAVLPPLPTKPTEQE